MLNACIGLDLFHFGNFWSKDYPKVRRRFLVSLFFINFLPFLLGGIIFARLGSIELTGDLWVVTAKFIGLFFMTLFVFIPYRIIHLIIAYNKYLLWDKKQLWNDKFKHIKERLNRIDDVPGQVTAIVYYFCLVILGCWLTNVS